MHTVLLPKSPLAGSAVLVLWLGLTWGLEAQQTVTLFFDNSGDEAGITTPGASNFSFMGSNFSDGIVDTEGLLPLYASGSFSYEIPVGTADVAFDDPVDSVEFFFVHGLAGFGVGEATAYDVNLRSPLASQLTVHTAKRPSTISSARGERRLSFQPRRRLGCQEKRCRRGLIEIRTTLAAP